MSRRFYAHSRWDTVLVSVTLTEVALTSYATLSWGSRPLYESVLLGICCILLNCMNYQCIAHSFIHHPFFSSKRLNRVWSVVSSLALQAPQTLYRVHHLDHHRYNNDVPSSATGLTGDSSSTYRYARQHGREEHIIPYAFLGPLRTDYGYLYRGSVKHGDARLTWIETAALVAYVGGLALLNWKGALFFYLPVFYLGQVFALAHNYAEHRGAQPGNRLTNSVSCYGRVYNKLWFNEGYHQEHHYRPQVHWTKLPQLRRVMLPEAQRRVVPYIHWVNFVGGGSAHPNPARVARSRRS